jgi:hypothetical protein
VQLFEVKIVASPSLMLPKATSAPVVVLVWRWLLL